MTYDERELQVNDERELQEMLNELNRWYVEWKLNINPEKSNVVHFRGPRLDCTQTEFKCGDYMLAIVK
jgi:hypothetical protein